MYCAGTDLYYGDLNLTLDECLQGCAGYDKCNFFSYYERDTGSPDRENCRCVLDTGCKHLLMTGAPPMSTYHVISTNVE